MNAKAEFEANPSAASLVEGLRDFGYTLETALADIVDNAISAGATEIEILADVDLSSPRLAVVDNGVGMSESALRDAMRPGSRNPLESRAEGDLGRFGLGMKTASFSQCRKMTVVTRNRGVMSAASWDLDHVAKTDRWVVLVPNRPEDLKWVDRLEESGTVVIWEDLDRIVGSESGEQASTNFTRRLEDVARHLELVFHRFLVPEGKTPAISIRLNNRALEPFDPFNRRNPATVIGVDEKIKLAGQTVAVRPYTLPHHSKVSSTEWEKYAGNDGYIRNQGFYVYRARRLIVWGTWFGLARQSEQTKLARVSIDIPTGMDDRWKVNVLKASAQPPSPIRNRLRKILEPLVAGSKRIYRQRGVRQTSGAPLPVWERVQERDGIAYRPSLEHPAVQAFVNGLDSEQGRAFGSLLEMLANAFPMDALLIDMTDSPELMKGKLVGEDDLKELVQSTVDALRERGVGWDGVRQMMQDSPPFSVQWSDAEAMITEIEEAS